MTTTTPKPLALELAEKLEAFSPKSANELRRQHQAIVELQADAERYRWLRANFSSLDFLKGGNRLHVESGDAFENLDVVVDTLRANLTKQEP